MVRDPRETGARRSTTGARARIVLDWKMMRAGIYLLLAVASAGCSAGLGPRQPLAEQPIGTTTSPTTTETASDEASSSGMVAAKIEESEAKKSASKAEPTSSKPKPSSRKGGKRR